MAKITCPQCEVPITVVTLIGAPTAYCSRCGWNREVARADLHRVVLVNAVLVILGVILASFVFMKRDGTQGFAGAILVAFFGIFMLNGLPVLRHLHRLKSIPQTLNVTVRDKNPQS